MKDRHKRQNLKLISDVCFFLAMTGFFIETFNENNILIILGVFGLIAGFIARIAR